MIEFTAYGDPKGQPRPRAFARKFGDKWRARVYDAGTAEGWKSQVAMAAKPFVPPSPIDEPLRVTMHFYFPRPKGHYGRKNGVQYLKPSAPDYHTSKPDFDNTAKAVSDALTQIGFWKDDALVVECNVSKLYEQPYQRPGVRVVIESLIFRPSLERQQTKGENAAILSMVAAVNLTTD
jgi:Holliday junction resolvase RusA-like endonuclease